MHVAIVCAHHGRPALLAPWWAGVRRLVSQWGAHGIRVTPVISGDEPEHKAACEASGGVWVHCRNNPVGAKHNAASIIAGSLDVDYIFVMGSDDFVCPRLAEWYPPLIHASVPFAGIKGCFFWETATDRMGLFEGYPEGSPNHLKSLGTARLIHRSLLHPVNWKPWERSLDAGLDASLMRRVGPPPPVLRQIGPDAACLDVKTGWNIWSFNHLAKNYPGIADAIAPESVLAHFPEDLAALRGAAYDNIGQA
jgi:hypothetical protein